MCYLMIRFIDFYSYLFNEASNTFLSMGKLTRDAILNGKMLVNN